MEKDKNKWKRTRKMIRKMNKKDRKGKDMKNE